MATPRITRARELAQQLAGTGITATEDVGKVVPNLPCVLVGPPVIELDISDGATVTWRLLAIAQAPADQHLAWQQLDELVDALDQELPIERAEPTAWAPAPNHDPFPAYAVTFTETL